MPYAVTGYTRKAAFHAGYAVLSFSATITPFSIQHYITLFTETKPYTWLFGAYMYHMS